MYGCLHVDCMSVCLHACMYVDNTYVHVSICMHIMYLCIYIHVCVCMNACTDVCVFVQYVCIWTCMHTQTMCARVCEYGVCSFDSQHNATLQLRFSWPAGAAQP